MPVLDLFAADVAESAKLAEGNALEAERRQKIRAHLKSEILSRMSSSLDDVLQMV